MHLADRVAQCRAPFIVRNFGDGRLVTLTNSSDFASTVSSCPARYVLSDDLTRLCADLSYSRGAGTLAFADLLRVPASCLWVEWCQTPWQRALQQYGFAVNPDGGFCGRRGVLISSSKQGRRGLIRTFWDTESSGEVLASSVESYFDFDTGDGEEPEPPGQGQAGTMTGTVHDSGRPSGGLLARCFRFRYERSWSAYYQSAGLTAARAAALWRHALGTIALDIPLLLAFLLLLASRSGLPRRRLNVDRLNSRRTAIGKAPLLEHIELRAPLFPAFASAIGDSTGVRRRARLHHVRGHLVRRGARIFWRVPHLRGRARSGAVRTRTVVWTFV